MNKTRAGCFLSGESSQQDPDQALVRVVEDIVELKKSVRQIERVVHAATPRLSLLEETVKQLSSLGNLHEILATFKTLLANKSQDVYENRDPPSERLRRDAATQTTRKKVTFCDQSLIETFSINERPFEVFRTPRKPSTGQIFATKSRPPTPFQQSTGQLTESINKSSLHDSANYQQNYTHITRFQRDTSQEPETSRMNSYSTSYTSTELSSSYISSTRTAETGDTLPHETQPCINTRRRKTQSIDWLNSFPTTPMIANQVKRLDKPKDVIVAIEDNTEEERNQTKQLEAVSRYENAETMEGVTSQEVPQLPSEVPRYTKLRDISNSSNVIIAKSGTEKSRKLTASRSGKVSSRSAKLENQFSEMNLEVISEKSSETLQSSTMNSTCTRRARTARCNVPYTEPSLKVKLRRENSFY